MAYIWFAWVFTVFTFWSAMMKSVKLLTKPDEEAKAFGFLDGGRGIVEAVLGTFALYIFVKMTGKEPTILETAQGLSAVIIMYSCFCFILSLIVLIFIKDEKKKKQNSKTINFSHDLLILIGMKKVWLVSIISFCGYTMYWTIFYFSGFLTTNMQISSGLAAAITTAMLWMRPIGAITIAMLADKVGRFRVLKLIYFCAAVGLILLVTIDLSILLAMLLICFIALMTYAIRGIYWSLLEQCEIENHMVGLAIGFISFFGYLPDVLVPYMSSVIFTMLDNDVSSNILFFLICAVIGPIGIYFISRLGKICSSK